MDQPKLERLLRLMKMLTANQSLRIDEIASKLDITPRTIYRYIDTFREAGFVIKKNGGFIKLDKSSPYFREISQLIHFTEEEAYILKAAIESIDENNLLKQSLKKKLYTVYDYKILAETIVSGKNGKNVQQLVHAIENKKKVILKNYSSAHGNVIRDREVEAYAFTTNYVQLWCYCAEEDSNKLFKVSRVESVEVLPQHWQHEAQHRQGQIDLFRMTGARTTPVKLRMGIRAANLLMEEFPLASEQMTKVSDTQWLLETGVCSLDGVGRFVMGLLDDIEIIGSPELELYISGLIKNFAIKFSLT